MSDDLPRVDVVHDLDDAEKLCGAWGSVMEQIGETITEQLCVVPQQHFVVHNRQLKYACSCKQCIRSAKMAPQPIPGSGATARLIAYVMVRKYLEGLPLYRQEKIAQREGVHLPCYKLARWMINGSAVFICMVMIGSGAGIVDVISARKQRWTRRGLPLCLPPQVPARPPVPRYWLSLCPGHTSTSPGSGQFSNSSSHAGGAVAAAVGELA